MMFDATADGAQVVAQAQGEQGAQVVAQVQGEQGAQVVSDAQSTTGASKAPAMHKADFLALGLDDATAETIANAFSAAAAEAESRTAAAAAEADRRINAFLLDTAIDNAIKNAGARNPKVVKKMLSMDDIHMENGIPTGLAEQLQALTGDPGTAFLFEDPAALGGVCGAAPQEAFAVERKQPGSFEGMSYEEIAAAMEMS